MPDPHDTSQTELTALRQYVIANDIERMSGEAILAFKAGYLAARRALERDGEGRGDGGSVSDREGLDGTARLCRALYGRKERAGDYVGGSDACMLHDAADALAAARQASAENG